MHALFGWVSMHEGAYERAGEVQQLLTETGAHRSAGPVDLLTRPLMADERAVAVSGSRQLRGVVCWTGSPWIAAAGPAVLGPPLPFTAGCMRRCTDLAMLIGGIPQPAADLGGAPLGASDRV